MTEKNLHDLLNDLCADPPTSDQLPGDDIRRGRRLLRRRRVALGGTTLASVAVLAVGVTLAPDVLSADGGASDSGVTSTQQALSDGEILEGCAVADEQFRDATDPAKAGGGTDPIDDWRVEVSGLNDRGVTAVLVSPDRERYAFCGLDERGSEYGDYYRHGVDVVPPSFDVWVQYDRERCEPSDPESGRCLAWYAGGLAPAEVDRVTFRTPDGEVTEADVSNGYYVWTAESEGRVDETKPVWATFYDADDEQLARRNANAASGEGPVKQCSRTEGDDTIVWTVPEVQTCADGSEDSGSR
ncbi:MAG: hypothetical protein GEU93_02875 [Propionibacteriales bacterium]|nr:hypothetical protein [Propionibacteriales bacterium]